MQSMSTLNLNLALTQYEVDVSIADIAKTSHQLRMIDGNDKKSCNKEHARQFDESLLADIEEHQLHPKGKHKCCQCAYNSGFQQGAMLQSFISLDIDSLGDAHMGANGHYKSVHQAFAIGYSDGVNSFIRS